MDDNLTPQALRNVILSCREPFVIKNKLKWKLLKWSLEDWQRMLKEEKLQFRCGTNSFTQEPLWERTTSIKTFTFQEFLEKLNDDSEWMYFDYKYLREWFSECEEITGNIKWEDFGFPELNFNDSTIWIGSKGAHTSCHVDTYGCNLIAQIYGRKQWILFPPSENLKARRVPYEESSIYSGLNFYSPTLEDFNGVKNCRKIILEPGDVLYVPKKWWHYVENVETAITINVWIPLANDNEDRVNESLIQFFISNITRELPLEMKNMILNPNTDQEMGNLTLEKSLKVMETCKELYLKNRADESIGDLNLMESYFKKYPFLKKIAILSDEEFLNFLKKQHSRFLSGKCNKNVESNVELEQVCSVINAYTHPDVIELVKNKFLGL